MPNIPNLKPDPLLPQYRFNTATGRYIAENGRFVPLSTVRAELDLVIDDINDQMVSLSRSFRAGEIDGRTFQQQGMALVKQTNLAGAALEKGGWYNMTQADFGRVGQIVRGEYEFFRNMVRQIESGQQKLDGTLDVRMGLYAKQGRGTYHALQRVDMRDRGFDEERNILHGRDHCRSGAREGCVEQTALGWVPTGTLVNIGRRTCLSNCLCDIEFRKSREIEQ